MLIMEEYENPKFDESIEERYPLKLWMLFEVQAINEKVANEAMKKHIESLGKEEGVFIKKYLIEDAEKLDAPENIKKKGISHVFSVVAEVVVHINELSNAFKVIMNYAPSSIEVIAPEKYELSLQDLQESLNSIADFMHKILSYGLGGVVLKV